MTDSELAAFWEVARAHARLNVVPGYFGQNALESVMPPAWSFGADAETADELLELVLAGEKTATTSALRDYDADGDELPQVGTMSILLDGSDQPRALIVTTDVEVVPFHAVTAAHAEAEGESDRTIKTWREIHQRFFAEDSSDEEFSDDLQVVLERFKVLYPKS